MIRLTFFSILFTSLSLSFASTNPAEQDVLVTLRGDTIIGNAEINLLKKWVEIRGEETYRMVRFRNIYSLQLKNTKGETVTEYQQYDDIDRTTKAQLLRQIVDGPVHLLVKSVPHVTDAYEAGTYLPAMKKVVSNDYYLWHEGDLMRVTHFRKQMMKLCQTSSQRVALQEYVEKYKFRYSSPTDQVAIVKRLNAIRQEAVAVASIK